MGYLFYVLVLLKLISIKSQHFSCPSNQDCVLDCTSTSTQFPSGCASYIMQAANAANLKITCSANLCTGITISCPYDTEATCEVDCAGSACANAIVNYPQPQNVIITCTGTSACTSLTLSGPDTFSDTTVESNASISCLGSTACSSASFDINYVRSTNILCKYTSTSSTAIACPGTKFYADYASDVTIDCDYYDCGNIYVSGKYIKNELRLNCNNNYACAGSIHVSYANHFSLSCTAHTRSCNSVNIYPNKDNYHSTKISCAGADGCYGIYSHTSDDYVLNYVDFVSTTTTITTVRFYCSSRGYTDLFYNTFTQKHECDTKVCCPWQYGDIVCNNNDDHGNCTINCFDNAREGCANKVIDAVNATSLTVICNSTNSTFGGCENSIIFCPRNMIHKYGGDYLSCNVNCKDVNSCWGASISSYDDDEINLLCDNYLSCTRLTLWGDDTKNANIQCTTTNFVDQTNMYEAVPKTVITFTDHYDYFSAFTSSSLYGWSKGGSGAAYVGTSSSYCPSYPSHCIRVYANSGHYYYIYRTFDMDHAYNLILSYQLKHSIYNSRSYYTGGGYVQYDCGLGWTTLVYYCYSYNCAGTGAVNIGYGQLVSKSFSLPSRCNFNNNVKIRFYVTVNTYHNGELYINNVELKGTPADETFTGSCYQNHIMVKNAKNVLLNCNGTTACVNTTISAQNVHNMRAIMQGAQSDINSVINAQNSSIFSVSCGSRYAAHFVDACWKSMYYGNNQSYGNRLKCESYGCNSLSIYSPKGLNNWNITVDGCLETPNIMQSVSYWNISCGNDYKAPSRDIFNGATCGSNNCNCQSLLHTNNNLLTQSYDSINQCLLEKPDILCTSTTEECNIDCSSQSAGVECAENAVTGATAKGLTVTCNKSCFKTLIYCSFNHKCKLLCDTQSNVCNRTEIYGGVNQDIEIDCNYNKACNDITVYANISSNININCRKDYACNGINVFGNISSSTKINCFSSNSCNDFSVYLTERTNDIVLNCYLDYSCNDIVIHAINSSKLNVNCYSNYSCNDLSFYTSNASEIVIECFNDHSCNNMNVFGENVNNSTLNCLTNNACNYLSLYLNYSNEAYIKCYSYLTDNQPACNHLNLFGSYITDYIDWECFGDYACSHNELHAEYSNEIDLIAFGNRALYYGHVFAADANKYNLTCSANDGDMYTCFSSTMQGPAKSTVYPYTRKAYLNCYGKGCYSLNLDSDSGFDDWVVYFNGCNQCNSITDCFDYWYLTCSDMGTDLNDHYVLNYYYGDSCKTMTGYDCKCVEYISILSNNFVNQDTTNPYWCDFKVPFLDFTDQPTEIPTKSPTNKPSLSPTTEMPSKYPTNIPTKYPSNNPSKSPTGKPSLSPTNKPSYSPTTYEPSTSPTTPIPSISPTNPTVSPTTKPSNAPIPAPTGSPNNNPTFAPINPTVSPTTVAPTLSPNGLSSTTKTSTSTSGVIETGTGTETSNGGSSSTRSSDGSQTTSEGSQDSFVTILEDNYIFIIIGVIVFICCIVGCCALFIYLYCRKEKQMKKVLEDQAKLTSSFNQRQNNVELMQFGNTDGGISTTNKLQFATINANTNTKIKTKKPKNKYAKINE